MLVLVCHMGTLLTYQVLPVQLSSEVVLVFLAFKWCDLRVDSYASLWCQHDVDNPGIVSIDFSIAKTVQSILCARVALVDGCDEESAGTTAAVMLAQVVP